MCLGIPGRIVAIVDAAAQARAGRCQRGQARDQHRLHRRRRAIADCVGDWVLVHVGFAMSLIDETAAAETLRILTELGEAQQEIAAMRASGRA